MNIKLGKISVANDESHHLYDNKPLYAKRFMEVLKFHPPGLAAVLDETGAYHIDVSSDAVYSQRYLRTFGFYDGVAAVVDDKNWFHVLPEGGRLYSETYVWCGNFQGGVCVVRDFSDNYFHIDLDGKPLYEQRYLYAGDFKDGIAAVQNKDGMYAHIYADGKLVHDKCFYDLDIFHKGFARAKDNTGWYHINKDGRPLYSKRYKMIEHFYNGFARVEDCYGAILIINESGKVEKILRDRLETPLQKLSADLVGYWRTQTIRAAVELDVFEHLPADENSLATKTELEIEILKRLIRALRELDLIYKENNLLKPTEKGKLLQSDNELSLAAAATHWGTEHYMTWMNLADSLKRDCPMYLQENGDELFEWLDQDESILQRYQTAMTAYAKHDYKDIVNKLDLSKNKIVIDAGGGQGVLLDYILQKHNHLEGFLLERAAVIQNIIKFGEGKKPFALVDFDLFTKWPKSADVIFMSRVLHDWDDKLSVVILKRAKEALLPNGSIYLVEMLLDEELGNGGMLDLNMLVVTGGMERTKTQLISLIKKAGLDMVDISFLSSGNYILKLIAND